MPIKLYKPYYDSIEANIVQNRLTANGIPCFLTNEHSSDMLWVNKTHSAIGLMMHEKDFQRADLVMQEHAPIVEKNIEDSLVFCPECGSNNVRYGISTKVKMSLFGMLYFFLFFIPLPSLKKGYHCFHCDLDFKNLS